MPERDQDTSAMEMMEQDSEDLTPTDGALKEIAQLAQKQVELEDELASALASVAALRDQLDVVQSVDLPTAMRAANLASFTLENGDKVEIIKGIDAKIPLKHKEDAHVWLRDNGHGDLIKNEVIAQFARGHEEDARAFASSVAETEGTQVKTKEAVHSSTLKAFVKEQLQRGVNVPHDLFGVFEYQKSKVTKEN